MGIKDFFDTAGIRTTAGFEHFRNRIPDKDAEVVTQLKAAGAIVVGKTNMHELGMGTTSHQSYFGPVHNPWQLEHVSGGSSGGSAAALASGLCYATIDTDAIGSCRLPAALCGVTGFKGSFGLISSRGILEGEGGADELILKLAHTAIQCRSAADVAMVLKVMGKPKTQMGESKRHEPIKLGVASGYRASEEIKQIFEEALRAFGSLKFTTTEIKVPLSPPFSIERIEEDRANISASLFAAVDVVVLPTTTDTAPTLEQAINSGPQAVASDNTYFCNYYGLPAISVPCGFDSQGLPVGLQIVGPTWGDEVVLAVAQAFQQNTQWHHKHPAI